MKIAFNNDDLNSYLEDSKNDKKERIKKLDNQPDGTTIKIRSKKYEKETIDGDVYWTSGSTGLTSNQIDSMIFGTKFDLINGSKMARLARAIILARVIIREAKSPSGWSGTTKKMKEHKEIDNPFALAYWMKDQGYKPHYKEEKQEDEIES